MDEDPFHDYSTPRGRLEICKQRCQAHPILWISGLSIAGALLILLLLGYGDTPSQEDPKILLSQIEVTPQDDGSNASLVHIGNSNQSPLEIYPGPSSLSVPHPETISKIQVSNVALNSTAFSAALTPFVNIQSLILTNVTLLNSFSPVYLPKLQEFTLDEPLTHERDNAIYAKKKANFKIPEQVRSILFFQKEKQTNWTLDEFWIQGVDISYSVGGTTFLLLNQSSGQVVLNLFNCGQLLSSVPPNFQVRALSIAECKISPNDFSHVPSLESLLLGHVNLSTPELTSVLNSLPNLKHFIIDGNVGEKMEKVGLDLMAVPRGLEKLALSRVDIMVSSPIRPLNISSLTIASSISPAVIKDFPLLLPTLKETFIFGIKVGAFDLTQKLLKTPVTWVLFEQVQSSEPKFLKLLSSFGVPKEEIGTGNFLLTRAESDESFLYTPLQVVNQTRKFDWFRYEQLGWSRIDTFETYLYVRHEL